MQNDGRRSHFPNCKSKGIAIAWFIQFSNNGDEKEQNKSRKPQNYNLTNLFNIS